MLLKKHRFTLDRELNPPKGFEGVLLAKEFMCWRMCCIGEDSIVLSVEKGLPILRVAREETVKVLIRPSNKQLEGKLVLALVMDFSVGEINIHRTLARQTVPFAGQVQADCNFIISTSDNNRADNNTLYSLRYRLEVEDLQLGLLHSWKVCSEEYAEIELS